MTDNLPNRSDVEATIRTRLIELIHLCTKHGIRIETIMREALDICDPESL